MRDLSLGCPEKNQCWIFSSGGSQAGVVWYREATNQFLITGPINDKWQALFIGNFN